MVLYFTLFPTSFWSIVQNRNQVGSEILSIGPNSPLTTHVFVAPSPETFSWNTTPTQIHSDFLHQAQVNKTAYTIAHPFNKCVSASIRMRFATATMIVRKEANQDDPRHFLSKCFACGNVMCGEF